MGAAKGQCGKWWERTAPSFVTLHFQNSVEEPSAATMRVTGLQGTLAHARKGQRLFEALIHTLAGTKKVTMPYWLILSQNGLI